MADVTEIDATTGAVTERDFTPEEVAQRAADTATAAQAKARAGLIAANTSTLHAQAAAALEQNRIAIEANPATVTLAQVASQVQALSAQNNALIRLVLGLLDEVG